MQGQVQGYYTGEAPEHLKLSQQKEFRSIKNAVIREAERVRLGEITFEDAGMEQRDEQRTICGPTAPCGKSWTKSMTIPYPLQSATKLWRI